jgi:hypothetical protein
VLPKPSTFTTGKFARKMTTKERDDERVVLQEGEVDPEI